MRETPDEGAKHQIQIRVLTMLAIRRGLRCLPDLPVVHPAFGELTSQVEPQRNGACPVDRARQGQVKGAKVRIQLLP